MSDQFQLSLPDVGEGVTEAEVVEWHIKVGDAVLEDQPLVDVMTDKVTVEIPSPLNGVISAIHCEVGDTIAVGSVVLEISIDGGGSQLADKNNKRNDVDVSQEVIEVTPDQADTTSPPVVTDNLASPLAAPATRRRASELGISLKSVTPTGAGGIITPEDLDAHLRSSMDEVRTSNLVEPRDGVNEIRIIGLRRKIAERMQDAKSRIPHFSYVEELDLTELETLRKKMNDERSDSQPALTLLPFFMRALALLQPEFPNINARYDDEQNVLHAYEGVHIGIATQSKDGLMVPVVRHVEARDIWNCANELKRVTDAARKGDAKISEMSGSTITLTSLGKLGGVSATPVINLPEVAIIGPNKLMPRPVVKDGQITVRTMMNLSSSFDHRIVDGYEAASYVQRLKQLLESSAFLSMQGVISTGE